MNQTTRHAFSSFDRFRISLLMAVVCLLCCHSVFAQRSVQEVRRTAAIDFNGDRRSDFAVIRRTNVDSGRLAWYLGAGHQDQTIVEFGLAQSDFPTPADFDGDGRTDLAVWRTGPAEQAAFLILESGSGRVRRELFGQTGDDPFLVGDYDGDGMADPAVFRCPTVPGQCTFFYRGSSNNPLRHITYIPWGSGTSNRLFPCPGDFDGDGKHDFCLQRPNPQDQRLGQFVLLRSSDGGTETVNWGLSSDRFVPGDYNGDGRSDFVVVRVREGRTRWYGFFSDGSGSFERDWGLAGDFLTPADYDGDGVTDLAVWRPDSQSGTSRFLVLRSSTGTSWVMPWGQVADYPPAEGPVH